MKGDSIRLTGLLEQILTSRLREGTSTRPTVTAQLAHKKITLFTSFPDFEANGTLMETQFTIPFSFSQPTPTIDMIVLTQLVKVIEDEDFDKLYVIKEILSEIEGINSV